MAPVRRSISRSGCCVFLLFLTLVAHNPDSLLVCDCQMLLDLRISEIDLAILDHYEQQTLLPFLSGIPGYLCRTSSPLPWRKRYRRRNKRGGCLVRLRAGLVRPDHGGYRGLPRLCVSRRWLDPVPACLVPVTGSDDLFLPRGPCPPCPRWRGVEWIRETCGLSVGTQCQLLVGLPRLVD